ncbi:MAG: UvrB domain 3-containing protein, partial [Dolichospermum sp.]
MAGYYDPSGRYIKGIEDELSNSQYERIKHQQMVVTDIKENWIRLSHNNKFHSIFATHSIPEAIDYYRLIKASMPQLKVTCLFDPNISNEDGNFKEYKGMKIALFKEQGLVEIIEDYNKNYGQDFTIPN